MGSSRPAAASARTRRRIRHALRGAGRARTKGGKARSYRVDWRGPISRGSGLGSASREYVRALRRQGLSVEASSSRGTPRRSRASRGQKSVLVYHHLPHTMDPAKARRHGYDKVILNTVWETTAVPARWRPYLNRYDAVLVPSRFNKKALRDSGVKVPIYLVPHGVDTALFRPSNTPAAIPGAKGRFVFLSVFGFQHRKNPEALLRAYWEEFTDKDNVLLVIKTSGYGSRESGAWIRSRIQSYRSRLRLKHRPAPVLILTERMATSKLKSLYTAADAFVLPTRGEGVGMPFMEAMASGIPVIATGWGGQMDFLKPSNSFLVPYRLKSPSSSMGKASAISHSFRELFAQKGQRWAEVELSKLKELMRKASSSPELCRAKGLRARQDMLGMSWSAAGRSMAAALDAATARAEIRRKPAWRTRKKK